MKTEAPKFENRLANRRTGWPLAATLILAPALWSAGCATTSTPAVESTAELGPSDPTAVASAKPKVPERQVSEDQKDDFDKAVARYEKLSKGGPLKGGDCDDAADAFRKVADANPNLLEARHDQAAVLAECGREAEAARIWEKLAEGKRPYSPALSSLGYLAWQKGDAAGAERYFTRAIEADKQVASVPAYINLSQILREKARRTSSVAEKSKLNDLTIRYLRTVLALDENNLQAYANLCYVYYDVGLNDGARLIGEQAVERAEEIATGKFQEDKDAPAAKTTKKGKKRDADSGVAPKVVKQVGGAAEGTGYTSEMKRNLGLVYNTLGLVWLKKEVYSKAIADFKKAIELDPSQPEARMNLAAISLNFRDYPTADQNFRAVLAAQPKNYEATIGLGVALRGEQKFDDAEAQYLAAQKLDPANPDSYFNLGLLYQDYKGGDKPTLQKAQQYYRDYQGRVSSTAGKKDASKRIKDIDDLFLALEDAAKLQKEAEEIQRKAEEQQKKMEEEMKKQGGAPGATSSATEPPAGTAPPASQGHKK